MWIPAICHFVIDLISLSKLSTSFMQVAYDRISSLYKAIPLRACTTFYLSIHPLMHIWIASSSWLLSIMLLWMLLLLLLSRFSRVRLCATPLDGSPPGSPIPGILQARTLEWAAISFSNAGKWKVTLLLGYLISALISSQCPTGTVSSAVTLVSKGWFFSIWLIY